MNRDEPLSTETAPNPAPGGVNRDVLALLIKELNVFRRHVSAYPEGHPIIAGVLEKVLRLLGTVLDGNPRLVLGIARDALMIDGEPLPSITPAFSLFAKALFDKDICSLTMTRDLPEADLMAFNQLLAQSAQSLRESGGIESLMKERGIGHIEVQTIDYGQFLATEGQHAVLGADQTDPSRLWEGFVHGLMTNTLDPNGQSFATIADIDPETLASYQNEQFDGQKGGSLPESYSAGVQAFLAQFTEDDLKDSYSMEAVDKLSVFVRKLNPNLRKQFLSGVFDSLTARKGLARSVLERFPDEVILEIMDDLNTGESYMPPMVLELLQSLSTTISGKEVREPFGEELSGDDLSSRMKLLFSEEKEAQQLPPAYRETLRRLLASGPGSMTVSSEGDELRSTLLSQNQEAHLSSIVLELMKLPLEETMTGVVEDHLHELWAFFLDTGDFDSLCHTLKFLRETAPSEGDGSPRRQELMEIYQDRDFAEGVLDGLSQWGRDRHEAIGRLVDLTGEPFVEPMLDRLAEEPSLSLRKYYISHLVRQKAVTLEMVLQRLDDDRWYYLRNLILLLRETGSAEHLERVRDFKDHSHIRVRQEVLKTLYHFGDEDADLYLVREMGHPDPEHRLFVVQQAPAGKSLGIIYRLMDLLQRGGVSDAEMEIKHAVIKSLAEIGHPEALTEIEKLLKAKSLLRPALYAQLKEAAIRSLAVYPRDKVMPLLEKVQLFAKGRLAAVATEMRQKMAGEAP